ncbi:hypothetical protein, partial [Armatimonas sp.]|uniref:hypothetical protein n=1 Tax=Armatimonas sp. TaxID=1872638 RepID=UPI00286D42BD
TRYPTRNGNEERGGFAAGETHNDQRRLTHSMDQIRGTGHIRLQPDEFNLNHFSEISHKQIRLFQKYLVKPESHGVP